MATLKLGVIGTNFVSDWLCEAAALVGGIEVDAVYSRREETGAAFAKKHGIPHYFTDLDRFLSSGIEAVYIASPTYLHYSHAASAIEKGLHVLCEKPFVMHYTDCLALQERAEEKGVVLMEAMRPAHDPALALVKNALGTLGKIRRVSFEYCQYSSRYDRYKAGEVLNAFTPSVSGGAIYDIGIYPLYWCVALFGEPKSVSYEASYLENGFEGGGSLLLGYGDFQATVTYSKTCDSVIPSVITGEKGSLTVDKMQSPKRITLIPRGGEAELLAYTPAENNLIHELADFVALIGGESDRFAKDTDLLYRTLNRILFPGESFSE